MRKTVKQKVLEFLTKNRMSTIAEIARATKADRNTVKIALLELVIEGKITRKKVNKRSYVYILQ